MMNDQKLNIEKLKSQLSVLKVFLVFYTIFHLSYLVLSFWGPVFFIRFEISGFGLIVALFHYMVLGLFLFFIWKKVPGERKTRVNSTFLILLLSVIGMWIWFPKKEALSKLEEEQEIID